jgi:hypothetical protein
MTGLAHAVRGLKGAFHRVSPLAGSGAGDQESRPGCQFGDRSLVTCSEPVNGRGEQLVKHSSRPAAPGDITSRLAGGHGPAPCITVSGLEAAVARRQNGVINKTILRAYFRQCRSITGRLSGSAERRRAVLVTDLDVRC